MSVEELLYRLRRVSYGLGLIYASLITSIIGGLVLAFIFMSAMSGPIGRAIQKAQQEEEAKQAQLQKDAMLSLIHI